MKRDAPSPDNYLLDRGEGGMSTCESVLRLFKDLLREGELKPGMRLPSERELAERFKVSRNTVREALTMLSFLGVIDRRVGSGTRVCKHGANALQQPFEFLMLLDQPGLQEIFETRELIECHLAACAAQYRTEEDLEQIQEALDMDFGCATEDRDPNILFHMAVARAAHRPVLERLLDCILKTRLTQLTMLNPAFEQYANADNVRIRHQHVYDAISAQDPAAARRAMVMDLIIGYKPAFLDR